MVVFLRSGALNVVWRVSRDGCLYGVDYAATKFSTDANTVVGDFSSYSTVPASDYEYQFPRGNLVFS